MEKCVSGIYKITNIINGKIYIGKSVNIKNRWGQHKRELRKNIHGSKYLQNSWNIYGEENFTFEVLEYIEDKTKLIEVEDKYIKLLHSNDRRYGYNRRENAWDNTGNKHSKETKEKIGNKSKICWSSTEYKNKMSKIRRDRVVSDGTKRKIKKLWENKEYKEKQIIAHKGYVMPKEQKQNISNALKSALSSKEQRLKRSEQTKGENNPSAKLTEMQVREVKRLLNSGIKSCDISKILNINKYRISSIKNGKSWSHIKIA